MKAFVKIAADPAIEVDFDDFKNPEADRNDDSTEDKYWVDLERDYS